MVKITVRLPDDTHKKLAAEAPKNLRSLNNEIVARLRASLAKPK